MSMIASIASDVQEPSLGKLVTMFKIDCTGLGGNIYYFVPATISGSTVYFNSIEYLPINMEATGFEYTSKGQMPRPEITISNTSHTMASAIIEYDDLLGSVVTRRRTFEKYLDGQPEADPTAMFPEDIYVIERKVTHNKNIIKWELSAYMDFEGKFLPKRQILRDTCQWRYRIWTGSNFDYSNVECPYTDSNMFKKDGTPTIIESEDVCGKRLSDCKLRYPDQPLPFGGFPGTGKIRV